MLFELTSAGRSLLDATPTDVVITRADLGDSFNYSLAPEPTGLDGSLVYSADVVWHPIVVNPNTLKYSLYLGADLDSFSFGEVALYSDSTLVGVGVNTTLLTKIGHSEGNPGQKLGLDFFIDLTAGQTYSMVNVRDNSTFPRLAVPDLLKPPAQNENNVYCIYGLTDTDVPYLAFADPTGKWGFSSKSRSYLTGTVDSVGTYGLQTLDLSGDYAGDITDLVLQFTSGTKRGYCRSISTQVTEGFTWTIPLAELPAVGDSFILVGPNDPSIPGPTGPSGSIGPTGPSPSAPFDVHVYLPGVPVASSILVRVPVARAVQFPRNFSGSYLSASANATATTLFDIKKNGSTIGSASVASGGIVTTFTTSGGAVQNFAAGDVISIIAPVTPDATLADVGIVLAGTR